MARTQRLDHENFPFILIVLLVITSLGTLSFIFSGNRDGMNPAPDTVRRHHYETDSGNIRDVKDTEASSLLRSMVTNSALQAEVVYIMPGGGSGTEVHSVEYPEWSRQRVVAAYKHSMEQEQETKPSIFITLSTSLTTPNPNPNPNSPNDPQLIFESQFMVAHLIELGVPADRIYGVTTESYSDSISAALLTRQFLEGILALRSRPSRTNDVSKGSNRVSRETIETITSVPLQVEIFISDFHAEQMKVAFDWVFGLQPSLFSHNAITLAVHSVSSEDIVWSSKDNFEEMIKQKEIGLITIHNNAKAVSSVSELYALLLLGQHRSYGNYIPSSFSSEGDKLESIKSG